MYLLILGMCCVLGNSIAKDLPPYIERCSITSADFSKCLADKSNIAIPHLLKDEIAFGVPSALPLYLPKLLLDADNLQIFCEDVYVDGLQNVNVTSAFFDPVNRKLGFNADLSVLEITGKYTITNGTILTRVVSGTGNFNITLSGTKLQGIGNLRIIERDDDRYIQVYGTIADLKTDRANYFFDNLESSSGGDDINEFIDKNWEVLRDDLLPSLKEHVLKIIRLYIPVLNNVPFNKLFIV